MVPGGAELTDVNRGDDAEAPGLGGDYDGAQRDEGRTVMASASSIASRDGDTRRMERSRLRRPPDVLRAANTLHLKTNKGVREVRPHAGKR